ncbi:hypothetical protein [Brevundimonas sp.]|nr:hypothetical protein [Brevundimonas sp.]
MNRPAAAFAAVPPASCGGETVRRGGLGMTTTTITTITTPTAGTG